MWLIKGVWLIKGRYGQAERESMETHWESQRLTGDCVRLGLMFMSSDSRGQTSLEGFSSSILFHPGRMVLRVNVMVLVKCVKLSIISVAVNGFLTLVCAMFKKTTRGTAWPNCSP